MNSLNLRPLPSLRTEENGGSAPTREGFVDETVVMALVSGRLTNRPPADPADLALAVDGDFAGWCLPGANFFEQEQAPPMMAASRRPSPPELEPGIGIPHQGSHRWWIAGLAGALCTLLFSALLLKLSEQSLEDAGDFSVLQVPAKAPAPAPDPQDKSASAPELTASPPVPEAR